MSNRCYFLSIAILFILASCAKPTVAQQQKIDPVLLAQLKGQSPKADSVVYYPCIIYTKEPEKVRKAGIHLNSVLPTFVTAQLTAKQIFKLIKLAPITYIESPKPDALQ